MSLPDVEELAMLNKMPIIMCGYCEYWLMSNGSEKHLKQVWELMKEHENTCPEKPKDE